MVMTMVSVMRLFYSLYLFKFALAFLQPELAQEVSDFCAGCNLSSDAGQVAAANETWGYLFCGLIFIAAAQMDNTRSMRKVCQFAMWLPLARLAVLIYWGRDALGETSNQFAVSVTENLVLILVSCGACYSWHAKSSGKAATPSKFDLHTPRSCSLIASAEQFILFLFRVRRLSQIRS